jgi:acetyl esterase/lipase
MTTFHPDLLPIARFLPKGFVAPWNVRIMQRLTHLSASPRVPSVDGVVIEDAMAPGPEGAPPVRVRVYRPAGATQPVPALLWIHGGGFVMGSPEQDQRESIAFVRELGIAVAAVQYRLAPQHPSPAPIDDCYTGLRWLHDRAEALRILPDRIAVGGASAGGGLAAGLVLMAHDLGEVPVAFQLLVYPMLDDRTALRTDIDPSHLRLWSPRSNAFGWTSYLGSPPGGPGVNAYASPARREDLAGLPPTWIGVGTLDLFHDEDVDYARRLTAADVACEIDVVPGAYHAFDRFSPKATVVQRFRQHYLHELGDALFAPSGSCGGDRHG